MSRLLACLSIFVILFVSFTSAQRSSLIKRNQLEEFTLVVNVLYNGDQMSGNMFLRGDNLGLNWESGKPMTLIKAFSWQLNLTYTINEVGQNISVKPLIQDKTWSIGANFAILLIRNSSSVDLYPWFFSKVGEYKVIPAIYSPQLNNTRPMVVYTPPSYHENTLKTYPVLVMQDGQNLFNDSTSYIGFSWHVQDTIDFMTVEGTMEEIVVVGPYNTNQRIDEYTYSYDPSEQAGGKGDYYVNFVIENVLPFSKKTYRIYTDKKNVGILGSSLGGLISCYAVWTRATVFGKAGCMSSSFWWNSEDFNNVILVTWPRPHDSEIYMDSGAPGDDALQTHRVLEHMEQLGFELGEDLFYDITPGDQHNEVYWAERFHIPMGYLYAPGFTPTQPF